MPALAKFGHSYYLPVPSHIIKDFGLKRGDQLALSIPHAGGYLCYRFDELEADSDAENLTSNAVILLHLFDDRVKIYKPDLLRLYQARANKSNYSKKVLLRQIEAALLELVEAGELVLPPELPGWVVKKEGGA